MPQPLQERTWLVDLEYCRERTGWTKNQFPPLSISKWSLWSHKSAQFHGTDDDEYYQEKNKKKKRKVFSGGLTFLLEINLQPQLHDPQNRGHRQFQNRV